MADEKVSTYKAQKQMVEREAAHFYKDKMTMSRQVVEKAQVKNLRKPFKIPDDPEGYKDIVDTNREHKREEVNKLSPEMSEALDEIHSEDLQETLAGGASSSGHDDHNQDLAAMQEKYYRQSGAKQVQQEFEIDTYGYRPIFESIQRKSEGRRERGSQTSASILRTVGDSWSGDHVSVLQDMLPQFHQKRSFRQFFYSAPPILSFERPKVAPAPKPTLLDKLRSFFGWSSAAQKMPIEKDERTAPESWTNLGSDPPTASPEPAVLPESAGVCSSPPKQSDNVSNPGGRPKAHLCECWQHEELQNSDDVVVPVRKGNVYRLELKRAGLFRCQKTGIKFQVKCAMTITYNLESWERCMKDFPDSGCEVLGPLFNIEANAKPRSVSAVYLPHFLCLARFRGDKAQVKCAHFKNENLTLESPSQINPFYIVLEDPDFSCLGTLLTRSKKKVPIHGIVLLYFRAFSIDILEYKEYKIHLYLLPHSLHEELDGMKMKAGYQQVEKPPTTATLYQKEIYIVKGPPDAYVINKALVFKSQWPLPYPFTEVGIKGDPQDTGLAVLNEDSSEIVWDTVLTKGELKELMRGNQSQPEGSQQPFVDCHRHLLIQRMSNIEEVLDDLQERMLLTQEQCDNVSTKITDQDKMRELYRFIRSWSDSDKEELYQILKVRKKPLIRDLECAKLKSRKHSVISSD